MQQEVFPIRSSKRRTGVANVMLGLLLLGTGILIGYWLTTFFGEPPLETPAPLKELVDDLSDLLAGREGAESPEPYPFPEGNESEERLPDRVDLPRLYPGLVFRSGNPDKPQVALTFDDGPDTTFTPPILDILRDHDVRATFFVTGVRVEQFPEVLQRITAEGHTLANHGYFHKDYTTLTPRQIANDLQRNNDLIVKITGQPTTIFRPPYAALDERSIEAVRAAGYKIVLWNVDSLDWRSLPKKDVLQNIIPNVSNGSIILQHSAAGPGEDLKGTVEALPEIIRTLRAEGYTFVTVHELLGISPVPAR